MADLLYDLLAASSSSLHPAAGVHQPLPPGPPDADALDYLASLTAKPLAALHAEEPLALAQQSQSLLLALQGLAKKSYVPVLESARRHTALRSAMPALTASTAELRAAIPALDDEVMRFSTSFRRGGPSALSEEDGGGARGQEAGAGTASAEAAASILTRRKQALLLSRNVERLVDVLELPPLLVSAVAAAPVNYASALDLNGHIRRLLALYPDSALVQSVAAEADGAMRATAASLVLSLKAPGLKLAASLRTISWLRRVLPDLEAAAAAATAATQTTPTTISLSSSTNSNHAHDVAAQERTLGALFLVCRLATLASMLDALAPLRELADQERQRQQQQQQQSKVASSAGPGSRSWSSGQQTERYLKRYIEIFREQSFAIVSMFRSIFPSGMEAGGEMEAKMPGLGASSGAHSASRSAAPPDPLEPLPPALATFPLYLVDMLLETLRRYLPTVRDQASRDSLLTQVLYCAGSLGRLGADFGLFLATLDVGSDAEDEWAEVVRRHRQLAGRLESIVGDPRSTSGGKGGR